MNKYQSFVFTLLRFMAGFVFFFHGSQKLLGWFGKPVTDFSLQMLGGYIETFGGLMIMAGLFTSFAAFIASGEMAYAYWMIHFKRGYLPIQNGGELAVMLCFVFLFLFTVGGGPWSLDRVLFGKRAVLAQEADSKAQAPAYAAHR